MVNLAHAPALPRFLGQLIGLAVVFAVWSPSRAQRANIHFERLTTADGLSQDNIRCITQDRLGFMWFGSNNGLNRYDGYEFRIYKHDVREPTTLAGNVIFALYEDRQGVLWVGTRDAGLNRYERESDQFVRFQHNPQKAGTLSHNWVRSILEDREGRLWVGTWGGGLNRMDRGEERFTHYRNDEEDPNSLSSDALGVVFEDREGGLWIGASNGLNRFNPLTGKFTRHPCRAVWDIHEDQAGFFWLASSGGLLRFDPSTAAWTAFKHNPNEETSLSDNWVRDIHVDEEGRFWLATHGGLDLFDQTHSRFMHYRHHPFFPHSLSHNSVMTIFEDRMGLMWIGTHRGLNKRSDKRFVHFQHDPLDPHSLSLAEVTGIHEDSKGVLWVGTQGGGLNRSDSHGEHFKHYHHEPGEKQSLSSDRVSSIYEDRSGELWVGTMRGLNRFDPNTGGFTSYLKNGHDPESLVHNSVTAMLEDDAGNFWIATLGGLSHLDRKSMCFTNYRRDEERSNGLGNHLLFSLFTDRATVLWVGSFGGLYRFETERRRFTHMDGRSTSLSLSSERIWAIHGGREEVLWLGTGGGLVRFDRATHNFAYLGKPEGLPEDVIYGILEERNGRLWLSTENGLWSYDPDSGSVKTYEIPDGPQHNEFNAGSYFQNSDGIMYFGGTNGFIAFHPQRLREPHAPPKVVLTDFLLFNRSVAPRQDGFPSPLGKPIFLTNRIELSHRDQVFSFAFSAMDFTAPKRIRYAYKLEGFDESWVPTGADKRFATYTDLDAGSYVFRVRADDREGDIQGREAAIEVTILPPPWKTWWAYSIYFLALSAIIGALYQSHRRKLAHERLVNERLRELDKLKDEFLANTSHELRTPLNGMIGLAESLLDGATGALRENTRANLAMLVASGKRLSGLVNDILDFSKLRRRGLQLNRKAVGLKALTDVVFTLFRPLLGDKPLALVADIPKDIPPVMADEDRLQQILFNLIGNAVKYTPTGSITVAAKRKCDRVEVRVKDTGVGIPAEGMKRIFEPFDHAVEDDPRGGAGLGLTVTKHLVELHGGRLGVESSLGQGSHFTFQLPVAAQLSSDSIPEDRAIASPAPPPRPSEAPFKPMQNDTRAACILVVDDEPVNRRVLINHLKLEGYRVFEAGDGTAALRLLDRQSFDLVLLDIMMPESSGYEVCRKIRQAYRAQELGVIFLSAKNQVTDLVTGLEAGGNDYLTKPIEKTVLLARVNTQLQLLRTHRAIEGMVAERAGKMPALDCQKSRYFTHITHELRTPIALTIGPLEDILAGDFGAIDAKLEEQHKNMLHHARQLLRLTDQLLEIDQLEAGQAKLDLRPQDLVAFLKSQVAMFRSWAERKDIALTFQTELPSMVIPFDTEKLEKILHNLLSNALKFTGDKGKVRVSLRMEDDQWIELIVKDTGKGIAQEALAHIFDRFYQASSTQDMKGNGIGLALVRELVHLHEGSVHVSSEPGFGSEFRVRLPSRTRNAKTSRTRRSNGRVRGPSRATHPLLHEGEYATPCQPPASRTRREGLKPTILVVEDHADMRAYLADQLRREYEVLEASSAEQALQSAKNHRPDLIISDVKMPNMDGYTLCRQLKTDPKTNHIPLVLLTVKGSRENRIAGLKLGADDYLAKPISSRELLTRVRNLIESRRMLKQQFSKEFTLQPGQVSIPSQQERFLERIQLALEQNLAQSDFGVIQLADALSLSPRELHRKVKALTGQGPGDLLRRFRLERAAQLCLSQFGSVSEITFAVGYNDPHYFSKIFRRMFGKTPSEYARHGGSTFTNADQAETKASTRKTV